MAYLILDSDEPYSSRENDWENFFEFDSSDNNAVRRIHHILSLRNRCVFTDSMNCLSDICESTLEDNYDQKNSIISRLFERVAKHVFNVKSITKVNRNYLKKQNLNNCHLSGANFHTSRV